MEKLRLVRKASVVEIKGFAFNDVRCPECRRKTIREVMLNEEGKGYIDCDRCGFLVRYEDDDLERARAAFREENPPENVLTISVPDYVYNKCIKGRSDPESVTIDLIIRGFEEKTRIEKKLANEKEMR